MSIVDPGRLASLRDEIHSSSFTPDASGRRRVGAEVELLALDVAARKPVPLFGGPAALIPTLRRYAGHAAWTEFAGYDGIPRFDAHGDATISFEPGGQIEVSSAACDSPAALVPLLHRVVRPLASWILTEGVELQSVGIDPVNDARDIPLQLRVDRYERMTRHFERIGPFGIRMMRQTAAIQVSLDRGDRPAERWRLLNDLAPYLIAIFANSPTYLGRDTGHQSFRAHCWRSLDPSRTGVAEPSDDPAGAYARFALGATEILSESLDAHLSTLFPEVRPRGHFEVRSCDAVAPDWYAAPIVFLSGIAYDERASNEAGLLAAESRALLRTAGELGLKDPSIARTARDLFHLALDGARRLGDDYIGGEMLEAAAAFCAQYTARDRSPADRDATAPEFREAAFRSPR